MSEYFGGDFLYTQLSGAASITALVGTAIYNARIIPQTETGTSIISFYRISSFDGGKELFEQRWSINCRSATDAGALTIAEAVYNLFNREHLSSYFGRCDILPVIPPVDETDLYNVPVDIYLRRRNA